MYLSMNDRIIPSHIENEQNATQIWKHNQGDSWFIGEKAFSSIPQTQKEMEREYEV